MAIESDSKQSDFVSVCVVDEMLIRGVLETVNSSRSFIVQKNERITANVFS